MEGGAGGAAEQVTTDWGLPSTGTGSLLVLGPEPTFKVSGAVLPLEALGEGPSLSPACLGAPGAPGCGCIVSLCLGHHVTASSHPMCLLVPHRNTCPLF